MKKPWRSLTFWAQIGQCVLGGLQVAGVIPPGIVAAIPQILGGAIGIYGRWRAKEPLSLRSEA